MPDDEVPMSKQVAKVIASLREKPALLYEISRILDEDADVLFGGLVGPWELIPDERAIVRRREGEDLNDTSPIAGVTTSVFEGFEGQYQAVVRLYRDHSRVPKQAFRRHHTADIQEALAFVDATLQAMGMLVVPGTPDPEMLAKLVPGYPRCLKCFECHHPGEPCPPPHDPNEIPF